MEEQMQVEAQTNVTHSCPVCRSSDLQDIVKIPQIPVLANVLWDRREDALTARCDDVRLAFCAACGHVFNQSFDPAMLDYDVQYENSLHFSPRFQAYASWLANYLINHHDLRGKTLVEVGSGKGEFLRLLCELGGNVGTGFDPSYEPTPEERHTAISFVKEPFSERHAEYPADLILSRHVLEHLDQPAAFVQTLRRAIKDNKRTVVYTEVPNLGYILRDSAIWDIIYEHYSYFGASSLTALFTGNGFNILNMQEAYEGQFIFVEAIARDASRPAPNIPFAQSVEALQAQVSRFGERSREKIDHWRERLTQMAADGKRVVVWGAGSKGISFLNYTQAGDAVQYIVDINPRKRNKYVTGAGQQIVPPDFLKEYRPDAVILMNAIYRGEVQATLEALGLTDVEFLAA